MPLQFYSCLISLWLGFHQCGRPLTAAVVVNPALRSPAGFTSGFSLTQTSPVNFARRVVMLKGVNCVWRLQQGVCGVQEIRKVTSSAHG